MRETLGYPALSGETNYMRYLRSLWDFSDAGGFAAQPADVVKLMPIQIPWTVTVDRVVLDIRVSAGNVCVGIYRNNGNQPDGGALVVESASLGAGGLGWTHYTIASTQLTRGLYWLAYNNSNGTLQCNNPGAGQNNGGTLFARSYNLAFGAFTNPCPVTIASAIVSVGWVRVASIP